jgi:hypothetical protein
MEMDLPYTWESRAIPISLEHYCTAAQGLSNYYTSRLCQDHHLKEKLIFLTWAKITRVE